MSLREEKKVTSYQKKIGLKQQRNSEPYLCWMWKRIIYTLLWKMSGYWTLPYKTNTLIQVYKKEGYQKCPGVWSTQIFCPIWSERQKKGRRQRKKTLVVTWLDITSAYGSIPSSLILATLHRAHVTEEICEQMKSYYSDVKIRLITTKFTTKWKQLEKRVTQY